MKILMTCATCMQEDIKTAFPFGTIGFRDDGRYEVICPKGHSSITLLQQQKFEILFDIGAYAILDGYYRESVSSFTSSLERFYEFFIKVICLSNGVEWESFTSAWKDVSNQSERQLGAFIFLHLQTFGNKPNLLDNNKSKFRNDVVHKGKIPTKQESMIYGQEVLNVIRPLLKVLKSNYEKEIQQILFKYMSGNRKTSDDGLSVSTMSIQTILSIANGEAIHDERSLEQALDDLTTHASGMNMLLAGHSR